MASPKSIDEIDLRPIPGKNYFNTTREWREEFIYFLLVDRFDDAAGRERLNQVGRSAGIKAGGGFLGARLKASRRISTTFPG